MVVARESVFCSGYFPGFSFYVFIFLAAFYCTFRRMSLLSFYIFFERRSIHTLIPLSDWEYQPEQVQAGICLFYNLLASLPSLAGNVFINSSFGSLCLFLLSDSVFIGGLFYVGMFLAFW